MLPGRVDQLVGQLPRDLDVQTLGNRRYAAGRLGRDEGHLLDAVQRPAPGLLGGRTVLGGQPAEVVLVRRDGPQGPVVLPTPVEPVQLEEPRTSSGIDQPSTAM